MFNGNSISISVSDDDSDEVGKMRVRVRRNREKPGFRIRYGLIGRIVRMVMRWWMFLLLLPPAGLVIFEVSSLERKLALLNHSHLSTPKKISSLLDRKINPNLNRLDPTTRVVGGVRQRKFLSRILVASFG